MNPLLAQIRHWSSTIPDQIALEGRDEQLSYAELWRQVDTLAARLRAAAVRHIAILLPNSPRWVVLQLAAFEAGIPVTPLPAFFSPAQQRHALDQSGVDLLFCHAEPLGRALDGEFRPDPLHPQALRRQPPAATLPAGTALVTFTSGSTGTPKGVCLSAAQLAAVCASLQQRVSACAVSRHACLLPLPILLENLAGVLLPLYAGSRCLLYPAEETGLLGSSSLDLAALGAFLQRHQPESLILTPELLKALLHLCANGLSASCFRLLAVGGARVPSALLQHAAAKGLPVMQGYGLSECGSVVALNAPDHNQPGSCGQPLAHCQVEIAADGEIIVAGAGFLGYIGEPDSGALRVATGDIGHLDAAGYLHVDGRKKNLFINSFGRNFSPEWIEAEFAALPQLQQFCVFGDDRPYNVAVLYSRPGVAAAELAQAIASINRTLPDYARVQRWLPAGQPFTQANGQLTGNGRLRRSAIAAAYQREIDALYQPEEFARHGVL